MYKIPKLIVLRGPSGAGKSTVAKAIRDYYGYPMAYIEKDYLRRIILKEKDIDGGLHIEFIKRTILFILENNRDVIVEGIFSAKRYENIFKEILAIHPENNYFFYFDVSLEETIKRHQTKPNKDEFGEKELREWYKIKDYLVLINEDIISEESALEDSVKQIISSIK